MKKITFLLQLVFILMFSQIGFGQEKNNPNEIKTTIGNFEFKAFKDSDFKKLSGDDFKDKFFRLVQFYTIPTDSQRKKWESMGLTITDYLSANTYYVVIDKQFPINELKGFVRAIAPIESQFKKEASLYFKGIPDYAKKSGDKAQLILSYFSVIQADAVIGDLKSKGVQILAHRDYSNQLDVIIDVNQLDAVTNLPYVQFIGAQAEDPIKETLDYRNTTGRANYLNTGYNGLNYNGDGVVIGVGEGGTVGDNIDFRGRVSEVGTSGGEESHKVGSLQNAAGAGNIDPANKNNAWGATLLSLDSSPDYSSLYTSHNLRYTNHSYGVTISGGYDSSARNHDLRIAALPNHLVSYSSGNSGTEVGFAPYNFANWSNITGQMKQNKNHISIGALSPEDQITGFSSRGPMYDGRIIPQLVLEGSEGTSYASPKVVGDLAILSQVYKDKNGGTEPASSLIRAVLMNTADDLGNPGPDYIHGYGRPNLRRAYNIINTNQIVTSSVANSVTNNHSIVIPANIKQVRVMIVWPDVAAAVNANPAIVNNLDLAMQSPSLTNYLPWVLDSTPNVVNISAPATRGVDAINTIEQVTVDNPGAGTWTVSVSGFNVPSGPQTYYLVYELLVDELKIVYPLENQKFVSGEEYYLRWDNYGTSGTFNLAYELNNSGTWVSIVNGYDANSRVFKWIAPTVAGGINSIKFRVQRDALTSVSGVNQIGNIPDSFRVSKACSDEVTLKWSPVANATSYKVYRLGAKYMEEVTSNITFSGNSAVLTGQSTSSSEYYAVSALTSSIEGQRTITIEKAPGDVNCSGIDWIGTISTDWFTPGNWFGNTVPTAIDNVIIPSTAPFQPVISAAGAVCATITINASASLSMSNTTAYTLSVSNDWINNGTFIRGIGTVDFVNTTSYQEISGSSTTNFNILKVTKGTQDVILEANSIITLNAVSNPLSLISGTFKLSSNSVITPFTSGISLGGSMGLWNNGGTINSGNFSWTLNAGLLQVSAGTTNIGTTSNNSITYLNNPRITVEGGILNLAGRIAPNSDTSSCTLKITEGTFVVNKFGSTSTTRAAFEMGVNASFSFVGGTLIIARASSNASDYLILSNSTVITGGTLQIGDASTPTNQTIRINSIAPIYNLTVNTFNSPKAQLVTRNITIKNNLTINGGTFDATTFDTAISGNWTNNGTFSSGTGKVTFDGFVTQEINGSSATLFKGLTLNNNTGLTLSGSVNATIDGVLNFTNGVINTGSNKLIITSNGSVSRTIGHVYGNLQKAFSGASLTNSFEIGDATIGNYTPVSITYNSITTPGNLTVTTQEGDHPNIATSNLIENKSINRYWTIGNSSIVFSNYSAVFNFLTSDVDAGVVTSNLKAGNYSTSWSYPTVGSSTSSIVTVTGLTTFGDFQFAEDCIETSSTQTETACDSFTWLENGQTYTTSGIYTHVVGCNTTTLDLTITPQLTWFQDLDNDGFGNDATLVNDCLTPGVSYINVGGDCDDTVASIYPGATEICYDGILQNCGGTLTSGCAIITAQLRPENCNSTLSSIDQVVRGNNYSQAIPTGVSITGYRFKITNLITNQVRILDRSNYIFQLTYTDFADYNTPYSVEVALRLNTEWMTAFGAACTITTPGVPNTVLAATSCGATLVQMNNIIRAEVVPSALNYEYNVALIEGGIPVETTTFVRSGASFNLLQLSNISIKFASEYRVTIRVQVPTSSGPQWSTVAGAPCSVFTPLAPEASIEGCGGEAGIAPANMNTVIYASPIGGATNYRFTLIDGMGYSQVYTTPSRYFRLSNFNSLSPLTEGGLYSVFVEVEIYGNFYQGKDCNILVPGGTIIIFKGTNSSTINAITGEFKAVAYPNPFATNFAIDVRSNSTSEVSLAIYDMTGRLLETRNIKADGLSNQAIGERYPAGIYNVIVNQGENTQTIRVVKQ